MVVSKTPKPPYYAVIFSSTLRIKDEEYEIMASKMLELAKKQKGFLGFESARDAFGISISYWESMKAIQNWKNNVEHQAAQEKGKSNWYKSYKVRIAKVDHDYDFDFS